MIIIQGLEFYGYHGVPDEEQKIGHRYSVNIELEGDFEAEFSDRIEDTIDYSAVCSAVIFVAQKNKVRTIERLSRLIAEELLASFSMIESINLEITKLMPPTPHIVASASYQQLFIRD